MDQFRFEKLKGEYDVEIFLVPFELRPDMPEDGLSAKAEGLGHSERVEQHLLRMAEEGGFPMMLPDLIPKTHKAMTMVEWVRDMVPARHWETHMAVFRAYYGEGADIGDRGVLLGVARGLGLDADDIAAAIAEDRYASRLHEFGHLAAHLGVDTTPSALICNTLHIGSRPYGVLRDALEECLVTPANIEERASQA